MEEGPSRELGDTADPGFRQHLVRHGRIRDVGVAGRVGPSLGGAGLVDQFGNVIGDDGTQVAGMDSVPAGQENVPHVAVDPVDPGDDR